MQFVNRILSDVVHIMLCYNVTSDIFTCLYLTMYHYFGLITNFMKSYQCVTDSIIYYPCSH